MKTEFDQIMNDFKKLNTLDKKEIVLSDAKKQMAMIMKLNKAMYNKEPLLNRELIDVDKPDSTYDDFLEASLSYLNVMDELLGNILDKFPNLKN